MIPYGFFGLLIGGYCLMVVSSFQTMLMEVCLEKYLPTSRSIKVGPSARTRDHVGPGLVALSWL